MHRLPFFRLITIAVCSGVLLTGCANAYKRALGNDTEQVFTRIFITDFNTAWQASLEALKANPLDVTNREGGFVQTKWTDNTAQKNFTETFGNADSYLKAQYRVRVTVAKGFYNGKPSVKISVQKDQLIQRDVLEGWRPIETDSIEEKSLLYRIGRIILIRTKLTRLEEDKIKKSLKETQTQEPLPDIAPVPQETPPPLETQPPQPETKEPSLDQMIQQADPGTQPPAEPVLEPPSP